MKKDNGGSIIWELREGYPGKLIKPVDGKSGEYFGTVELSKIDKENVPSKGNIIRFETTKDQDKLIFKNANKLKNEINTPIINSEGREIRKRYYHTLDYNCLISSLNVINGSGAGITIPIYNRSLVHFWMYDIKNAIFWYNIFPSLKPNDFPIKK